LEPNRFNNEYVRRLSYEKSGYGIYLSGEDLMLWLVLVALALMLAGAASFYVMYQFLKEDNEDAKVGEPVSSDKRERKS
jgi:flagellar basal body-associated protein FliL